MVKNPMSVYLLSWENLAGIDVSYRDQLSRENTSNVASWFRHLEKRTLTARDMMRHYDTKLKIVLLPAIADKDEDINIRMNALRYGLVEAIENLSRSCEAQREEDFNLRVMRNKPLGERVLAHLRGLSLSDTWGRVARCLEQRPLELMAAEEIDFHSILKTLMHVAYDKNENKMMRHICLKAYTAIWIDVRDRICTPMAGCKRTISDFERKHPDARGYMRFPLNAEGMAGRILNFASHTDHDDLRHYALKTLWPLANGSHSQATEGHFFRLTNG
jgi:hypothetical protein